MKFNDVLRLSLNSLMHRRLRSWLTVLGIVIGVAAVVALVSVGEGMQTSVTRQLGGLGANIITISPGRMRAFGGGFGGAGERVGTSQAAGNLTESDLRIIKATPGVLYANGIVSGRAEVSYAGQTASVSIQGVDTSVWKFMETTGLESGRYLSQGDTYVAVIGNKIANDVFKQPITLNRQITIGGQNFRVVGILEPAGFIGQQDSSIFIPRDVARTILTSLSNNQLSSITVQVSDSSNVQDVITQIEKRLMIARHVTEQNKDFTVTSAEAIRETVSNITQTMTLFLGGIAGISLLVGGIGVANTMFMSVTERTRLIGVLKALGATNIEIMKLFLTESAIMGLIGGLIGVFVGFLLSGIISEFGIRVMGLGGGGMGGVVTVVTPQLVLFAIGFSIFIGVISGLLPARRAAGLQPVEALRYE
jgi:putative ABC transport system permease protein